MRAFSPHLTYLILDIIMTVSAKERKDLPKSKMGLPSQGKYPMPNRSHAANAKARAKQQLDAGHITSSEYNSIVAKANAILNASHSKG